MVFDFGIIYVKRNTIHTMGGDGRTISKKNTQQRNLTRPDTEWNTWTYKKEIME